MCAAPKLEGSMNIAAVIMILAMLVLGALGYRGALDLDGARSFEIISLACVVVIGFNIIQAAVRK